MNKVMLMGRLTRDPEIRISGSGEQQMAIARFTLAVDRKKSSQNGEREADFISCVAFKKTAEFAEQYLHQGTKIAVSGRIQTGSYVSQKDNQKVYTTDVVVEEVEFAEPRSASGQSNGSAAAVPNAQRNNASQGPRNEGFMNIPDGIEDEGLPFN